MTRTMAQRRADQLRNSNRDPSVKYEVEPLHEGSRKYVIRSYRNDKPTGSVWHI